MCGKASPLRGGIDKYFRGYDSNSLRRSIRELWKICRKGKAFPHIRRQSRDSLVLIPTAPATSVTLSRTLALICSRRCRRPTLISTLTLSALSLSAPTTLALALSFDLDLGSGDVP